MEVERLRRGPQARGCAPIGGPVRVMKRSILRLLRLACTGTNIAEASSSSARHAPPGGNVGT
jgi:hypothetical protein